MNRDLFVKIAIRLGVYKSMMKIDNRIQMRKQNKAFALYGLEALRTADETASKCGCRLFLAFIRRFGLIRCHFAIRRIIFIGSLICFRSLRFFCDFVFTNRCFPNLHIFRCFFYPVNFTASVFCSSHWQIIATKKHRDTHHQTECPSQYHFDFTLSVHFLPPCNLYLRYPILMPGIHNVPQQSVLI